MIKSIKYFFEALGVKLLFVLFRSVGLKLASNIGAWLFKSVGRKLKVSKIAKKNLQAILSLSPKNAESTLDKVWDNLGRNAGEFVHIYNMNDEQYNQLLEIKGRENLRFLKEGGLLFTAHIGNWEILPRFIKQNNLEMALVYRSANNRVVDQIIIGERSKFSENISKGRTGAKFILDFLKKKKVIGMLVDQKMNDGMDVPFFGKPAMTAPAIARLTLKFDLPIIPIRVIRKLDNKFIIEISEPLLIENQEASQIMFNINKIIENWIREHPDQWFWLHKRWNQDSPE